MDELAKTEARNYLSAAGFFILAAGYILSFFTKIGSSTYIATDNTSRIVLGVGLLLVATLLIVLKKRDMLAILFFMMGFYNLFCAFSASGTWNVIMLGCILLVSLLTLTGNDKKKWMLFLIPTIWFVNTLLRVCIGYNLYLTSVFLLILTVICLYYAFCCACERCKLPGSKLLTVDEQTDFKSSGSVLGYMLFALIAGGYALYYLLGEAVLPLDTFVTTEIIAGALMIFVAILLLAVGKMRFTPIMFLLFGITSILSIYSSGMMYIGIGILWIIIGLFAMLRKESRILPGIMMIVYGCTAFFSVYANGAMVSAPVVSAILNAIPCLIAIYLAFVVYSQRKLPKF